MAWMDDPPCQTITLEFMSIEKNVEDSIYRYLIDESVQICTCKQQIGSRRSKNITVYYIIT